MSIEVDTNRCVDNQPQKRLPKCLQARRQALAAMLLMSFFSHSQQSEDTQGQVPAQQSTPAVNSTEVLRLEQTIRANKEQPQVLTIVPWQLPTHQRINETKTWQPVVERLPSIERSQFLRDLSVFDDISPTKTPSQTQSKISKE